MSVVRARFTQGFFVPLEPLEPNEFPEGSIVTLSFVDRTLDAVPPPLDGVTPIEDADQIGTGQALLDAARRSPHLQPDDIDALRAAIAEGRIPARPECCFDEEPPHRGSPKALVAAMDTWPELEPAAFDELEAEIEAGKLPVRTEGVFDDDGEKKP